MAIRSDENKVAQAFLKGINTLALDHRVIALAFALTTPAIQIRLMQIFREWLDLLEGAYDRDQYQSDEHHDLLRDAKRLNDGMRPYK